MIQDSIQEYVEIARSRGNAYRLLSRQWGTEMDAAMWAELQAAPFPDLPEVPELDAAYRQLKGALSKPASSILQELGSDYAVMCLGANQSDGADPYESVHRSPDRIMMQDEWEQVLYLYAELGLHRSDKTKEPEDHLALELECMAHLCDRAAEALESGNPEEAAWAHGKQISFLDQHLLQWVPSFTDAVLRLAKTEFYRAVAVVTREQLVLDRQLLDQIPLPVAMQP
jgi:putative dimethyl sulfoxide reductase chaperone